MSRSLYDIAPLVPLVEAGFVLLTPNFRLARRIKSEWDSARAAAGARAWEPVPVLPLESWLQQQWQLAAGLGRLPQVMQISAAQALELWQQVIAEEGRKSDSYHLLRPGAAAELASQARDMMLRWEVDMAGAAVRQEFALDVDCGTFLRWLALFEQRLRAAGQATALDCVRALGTCAGQLPPARLALLEFDVIPPLYRSIITAMGEQVREIAPAGAPGERRVYAFPQKRAELQAVARWAAQTAREEPGISLGVVLSDMAGDRAALEYLLRREFDCLGEHYTSLPVNFSTGISLDRAPVVRDALAVLGMVGPRTTVAAVLALLRSRFVRLPDASTPLAARFASRLLDAGSEELETAELRYFASETSLGTQRGLVLGAHLMAVSGMRELRRPALPSGWLDRFSKVLAAWGWPGDGGLDSLEYQQVELWYRTLDEFRAYDAVCKPLDFERALQLLRKSCSQQISQPQTRDARIQVLGPLEAAGLRFDHLWVCGMQASRWPAPARPNPFVPMALQRRLQMPHATPEREWVFAAALLDQYSRSNPFLHASYCREEDDAPELPSPLLAGFSPAESPAAAAIDPVWVALWERRQAAFLQDDLAPPVTTLELAGISGGSALLEDQSQCPFRAFARRRLAVEPRPGFSLALSAAERGSLLHGALNALWGHIGDHRALLALDETSEQTVLARSVEAARVSIPGHRRRALGATYWRLEEQRLASLLCEWLRIERARGEFAVYQRELDISLELGALPLRLRVDRIDQLPDGSRVIIDYKSGISRVNDWLGERPAKPQLLLYGIAAPGDAAAIAFAQVRPGDSKFVGLGRVAAAPGISTDIGKATQGRMDARDWDALNTCWRANLERLAAEFIAGQAQVDPLGADSCTWCGLQSLCRVDRAEEESA